MDSRCTHLLFLLFVAATVLAVADANKNFGRGSGNQNLGFNYTEWAYKHHGSSKGSNRIVVGGSENWRYGFNYTHWAIKNGPVYLNDTLVFKYDPPKGIFAHSVYLLPNFWSFRTCDFSHAKKVADVTQGGGEGFEFVVKKWQPYYFACAENGGLHCKDGMMKFAVMPLLRWHY